MKSGSNEILFEMGFWISLYDNSGLVAPQLRFYKVFDQLTLLCLQDCCLEEIVPAALVPGKKATVQIYKALRPGPALTPALPAP